MYAGLFQSAFGGLGVVARVTNNDADRAAFGVFLSQRHNTSLIIPPVPNSADAHDPYTWAMQDAVPQSPQADAFLGYPLSSFSSLRDPILAVANAGSSIPPDIPIPLNGHHVAVSALFPFSTVEPPSYGAIMFTQLGAGAGVPAYLLMAATTFDGIRMEVKNASTEATFTISDSTGASFGGGPCKMSQADQVLDKIIQVTPETQWTFKVGQCPSYTAGFATWRRAVILAICIVLTLMAMFVASFMMLYQDRRVSQSVERKLSEEKSQAHQLIMGYICHELRNPLHIIKTSFRS